MIITIDGPAGSGKSTAARSLAKRLGIAYLDTGATYRAVTLKALREGVDMRDQNALAGVARSADIKLVPNAGGLAVFLDGKDVSLDIRTHEIAQNIHFVASAGPVREVLVELQRSIGRGLGSFVAEGRDQGSVVFPDADLKFYLSARPEIRARRRLAEMSGQGQAVSYDDVLQSIIHRDRHDSSREIAPLVKPAGAIEIDTSDNTIEQTTAALAAIAESRL